MLGVGTIAVTIASIWCIVYLLRTVGLLHSLPRRLWHALLATAIMLASVTFMLPVAVEGDGHNVLVPLGWPVTWLVQEQPDYVAGPEEVTFSSPLDSPIVELNVPAMLLDTGVLLLLGLLVLAYGRRSSLL